MINNSGKGTPDIDQSSQSLDESSSLTGSSNVTETTIESINSENNASESLLDCPSPASNPASTERKRQRASREVDGWNKDCFQYDHRFPMAQSSELPSG